MNKVYFTKVFKGYSPEEVEAFIIKLNSDIQQKQQDFAAETKRLNSDLNELRNRFEDTISANDRLEKENEQLNSEKQELIDKIKCLSEEKKAPLSDKETSEDKPSGEDSKFSYEYKKLCEQMGERLLVADMRADEIVQEAQRKANKILAKAADTADEEIQKLIDRANTRMRNIYKAIEEYEKKQVSISSGLEQARKYITDAIGEVEALISADK